MTCRTRTTAAIVAQLSRPGFSSLISGLQARLAGTLLRRRDLDWAQLASSFCWPITLCTAFHTIHQLHCCKLTVGRLFATRVLVAEVDNPAEILLEGIPRSNLLLDAMNKPWFGRPARTLPSSGSSVFVLPKLNFPGDAITIARENLVVFMLVHHVTVGFLVDFEQVAQKRALLVV